MFNVSGKRRQREPVRSTKRDSQRGNLRHAAVTALVASARVRDLLVHAKCLFVVANCAAWRPKRVIGRINRRHAEQKFVVNDIDKRPPDGRKVCAAVRKIAS